MAMPVEDADTGGMAPLSVHLRKKASARRQRRSTSLGVDLLDSLRSRSSPWWGRGSASSSQTIADLECGVI